MQQPAAQQTTTEILDPAAQYMKRRKTALWVTIALLSLSMVVLAVGLASATQTDNVTVTGYYPGITLSFGAFLGIVGIHLLENRKPMLYQAHMGKRGRQGVWMEFGVFYVLAAGAKLTAAIIFISIGVIASFFCVIVDGIIAAEFIDKRPLVEDRCDFYASGSGYAYDNYYTEVTCRSFNSACKLKVKSNTCYCCYLYNCDSPAYHAQYYEFTGVSSCWDVIHLYRLLWACVVLNVLGLFLGIITAAILGAYKDMNPITQMSPSPAPPPHILYNPTQHMLTYAGFCPSGQTLPAYPNYPIPMQHHSNYQAPSTPQPVPEGGPTSTSCPSEEGQSQPPSQAPTQPPSQGGSQEPGGYMLTPNAPVLYGSSFGPFEKPPPYAC